jgi:hypothetical protein
VRSTQIGSQTSLNGSELLLILLFLLSCMEVITRLPQAWFYIFLFAFTLLLAYIASFRVDTSTSLIDCSALSQEHGVCVLAPVLPK